MATKRLMLEAHFPRGAAYGDVYFGLWYPIVVAVMTARVGGVFLRETKDIDIVCGSGIPAAVVRIRSNKAGRTTRTLRSS